MLSRWKRFYSKRHLQLYVAFLCVPGVTSAQRMGGMSATNHRYILPLYLSGGSWSTILHLHNAAAEESGVSLLVRGADGLSKKRLHLTLASNANQDINVGSLLPVESLAQIQAGSIVVVQESSMDALRITGSAELLSSAAPPASIAEPLSPLDMPAEQGAADYQVHVAAGTLTAISSVVATAQDLRIGCQPQADKPEKTLALPAHGTLLLHGCTPEITADPQPAPGDVSHRTLMHIAGDTKGTFVVFALDLDSGKLVAPRLETP